MLARARKKLGWSRISVIFAGFPRKNWALLAPLPPIAGPRRVLPPLTGPTSGGSVCSAPVAVSGSFSGIPVVSELKKSGALSGLGGAIRTLRPSQLVGKNAFVLAPVVFAKE